MNQLREHRESPRTCPVCGDAETSILVAEAPGYRSIKRLDCEKHCWDNGHGLEILAVIDDGYWP